MNKKIDKILEERFFHNNEEFPLKHYPLCSLFNRSPEKYWEKYWHIANIHQHCYMISYFESYFPTEFEMALLRLLIVEDFKEWLKESKNEQNILRE